MSSVQHEESLADSQLESAMSAYGDYEPTVIDRALQMEHAITVPDSPRHIELPKLPSATARAELRPIDPKKRHSPKAHRPALGRPLFQLSCESVGVKPLPASPSPDPTPSTETGASSDPIPSASSAPTLKSKVWTYACVAVLLYGVPALLIALTR